MDEIYMTSHIGNMIKDVLIERGQTSSWLADRIPCERSNVYSIFKRDNIGVDLLYTISKTLGHDFFADLSAEWNARRAIAMTSQKQAERLP